MQPQSESRALKSSWRKRVADCYCYTCRRYFHHLGIARHRAMHRDREQDCKIRFSDERIGVYRFEKGKTDDDEAQDVSTNI